MPAVTKTPDERRRNEKARSAILRAARELLDRRGFRRLTIEGIAERAGVGKATIYRWWPSKAAVAMDGVLEAASPRIPFPDTGSAREDVRRQIASVIELYTRTKTGRGIRALIAESQPTPRSQNHCATASSPAGAPKPPRSSSAGSSAASCD